MATIRYMVQKLPGENHKPGQLCKLSDMDKQKILHDIISGNYDTAIEISRGLAHDVSMAVSPTTVQRVLKEGGLHATPKVKKLMLSLHHHKARLEFANHHKH